MPTILKTSCNHRGFVVFPILGHPENVAMKRRARQVKLANRWTFTMLIRAGGA